MTGPVTLLTGKEPSLLGDAVRAHVDRLVGDQDRSLLVDEFAGDDYELAAVVDAAGTAPFLGDRRIVLARTFGRFARVGDLAPLLDYLEDPLPTSHLVLAWEPGSGQPHKSPPKKLRDAVTAAGGEVVSTDPGRKKGDRRAFVDQQVRASGISLDRAARARLDDQLGENLDRLGGVLATLVSAFGPGAEVTERDLEPFVVEAGSVPPWELTDAIDDGDIATALDRLHRLLTAGDRHPLALMSTLHTHYRRMARLDGESVGDEATAAELLGIQRFPASKALRQGRRLGGDRIGEALRLLAAADLDLRGRVEWPDELVMEVLVARLARLSRR